jgi:hypothetical protein
MCWNGEASAAIAVIGFAGSAYAFVKTDNKVFPTCLAYFSFMEALQAYSYSVIGECSNPENQAATLLAYLHVSFQPFFFNAIALHFLPETKRKRIQPWAYGICLVTALMMIARMLPVDWGYHCSQYLFMPFCGPEYCTLRGEWHLAWEAPLHDTYISMSFSYWVAAFLVPILYGAWRITLFQLLTGPLPSYFTTDNPNEWIAVWCLFSVGILTIIFIPPVRQLFYIRTDLCQNRE